MARTNREGISLGCLGFLLLLGFMSSLGVMTYQASKGRDLRTIDAYNTLKDGTHTKPRDLGRLLQEAQYLGTTIVVTEDELNAYLWTTLNVHQDGLTSILARFHGIWIELHPNQAEVIFERTVISRPYTSSFWLQINKSATGDWHCQLAGPKMIKEKVVSGGSIGSLPLPLVVMQPLTTGLDRLVEVYEQELGILKQARNLEIHEGKIIFQGKGTRSKQL